MGPKGFFARLAGLCHGAALALCDRCPACGGLLPGPRPGQALCPACADKLSPRLGGYCPDCGELAADAAAPALVCLECRREGRPWDGFGFHGRYEGLLRELVLGLKFHSRLGYGRLLADFLAKAHARAGEAMSPGGPDCIVPVPLHPRRLAWRGFNQSLELARGLGRALGRPVTPSGLVRIRDTTPQSSLPGAMRRENIQGAFAADPVRVAGRRVLLVDDVMTTGATVETAARALRRAGAARVDVVVVAR